MNEHRIERLLRGAAVPDESAAQARALEVVRAGFAELEQPARRRPSRRYVVGVAAALVTAVVVAGALTSPGAAVADWFKEALGIKPAGRAHAARALGPLPGGGRLLVSSQNGLWIVHGDGSRRFLGAYGDGAWSPRGLFVAAVRGRQLVAVDPEGRLRWAISKSAPPRQPRWAPDGLRIAYLSGRSLRIVEGDGAPDRLLSRSAAAVAPAWRPTAPVTLASVDRRSGRLEVRDVAADRILWRSHARLAPSAVAWSGDGRLLAAARGDRVWLYEASGREVARIALAGGPEITDVEPLTGRSGFVALGRRAGRSAAYLVRRHSARRIFAGSGRFTSAADSPDGRWLLIAWSDPDQWLFVRSTSVERIRAVGGITRQFNPGTPATGGFPKLRGWCCRRGGIAP